MTSIFPIYTCTADNSVSFELDALDPQKRELLEARFMGRSLPTMVSGCDKAPPIAPPTRSLQILILVPLQVTRTNSLILRNPNQHETERDNSQMLTIMYQKLVIIM